MKAMKSITTGLAVAVTSLTLMSAPVEVASAQTVTVKPRTVVGCSQTSDRVTRLRLANGQVRFVYDMTVRSPLRGVKWQHLGVSNRRVVRPRKVDYCRMDPRSAGGPTVSLVLNNGAEYHIFRPWLPRR